MQHTKKLAASDRPLLASDIQELHRLTFSKAWPDHAGKYRKVEVDPFPPFGDQPPHPNDVGGEMLMFGRELEQRTQEEPPDAEAAVGLAVWAHMETVRIHPFQEGNGKTARNIMNVILMRHVTGVPRVVTIPGHHRDRYMSCVKAARQGRPEAFESLLADCLEEMLEEERRRLSLFRHWRRSH